MKFKILTELYRSFQPPMNLKWRSLSPFILAAILRSMKDGEALVEPEVLPAAVGDQIAGPAVGDLVRHHLEGRNRPGYEFKFLGFPNIATTNVS